VMPACITPLPLTFSQILMSNADADTLRGYPAWVRGVSSLCYFATNVPFTAGADAVEI
jgi:hypothetical protein